MMGINLMRLFQKGTIWYLPDSPFDNNP
jgi:hypothetical protein